MDKIMMSRTIRFRSPSRRDIQTSLALDLQHEKLLQQVRNMSPEEQSEFSSKCALFVCNKWDQVPAEETEDVKNHVVKKLT